MKGKGIDKKTLEKLIKNSSRQGLITEERCQELLSQLYQVPNPDGHGAELEAFIAKLKDFLRRMGKLPQEEQATT